MPDTAIGSWNSNRASVLLGDGKCGFHAAPGSPFPAGAVPWSVAIGDLNKDGNPDIVIIPYGPRVHDPRQIAATVLLGDGKGQFTPMPGSPFPLPGCASPYRVAIGDVTGNGVQSFAVTCMHSKNILLFLGNTKGGFQMSSIDVPDGQNGDAVDERGIALADLTGDGKDAVIVTNGSSGTLTLLLSK